MVYLDHAATSPMRQVAIDAWVEHARATNPGSAYASGRAARRVLDDARAQIAELLGAEPIEVIITASGTEADNIAIQGLIAASKRRRVVTTSIEHPAVGETLAHLGCDVVEMPVDRGGHVCDLSALDEPAALATCMLANNETGAIQPVADIVARATRTGTPVHVDAVQAVAKVPINFAEMGATTLASSAHKYGGPRGIGFLLAKRSPAPSAIIHGGGQERGLRPGTVDVASAAAMAAALSEAIGEMTAENARVSALRDEAARRITEAIDDVVVNTVDPALPGHLHLSVTGADGDSLIMLLDAHGIEASSGSACHAGVNRMSHVLEAMGVSVEDGLGALRLTFGSASTREDIDALMAVLPEVVATARKAGLR